LDSSDGKKPEAEGFAVPNTAPRPAPITSLPNSRNCGLTAREATRHLGARRAESSTRAQTMAASQTRNGLRGHPDLPRVWVSNPIEFLSTEEVWA
jgi:hypothetical protein